MAKDPLKPKASFGKGLCLTFDDKAKVSGPKECQKILKAIKNSDLKTLKTEPLRSYLKFSVDAQLCEGAKFEDYALHSAIARGQEEILDFLLKEGLNPNAIAEVPMEERSYPYPLNQAVKTLNTKMVKSLIKAGATYSVLDLFNPFDSPLWEVFKKGKKEIAEMVKPLIQKDLGLILEDAPYWSQRATLEEEPKVQGYVDFLQSLQDKTKTKEKPSKELLVSDLWQHTGGMMSSSPSGIVELVQYANPSGVGRKLGEIGVILVVKGSYSPNRSMTHKELLDLVKSSEGVVRPKKKPLGDGYVSVSWEIPTDFSQALKEKEEVLVGLRSVLKVQRESQIRKITDKVALDSLELS